MQDKVSGHELSRILDRAPDGLTVLSLDCFDTLIWRNTHAPSDVFAELNEAGGGIEPRVWAEVSARRKAFASSGAKEIRVEQVYESFLAAPDAGTVAAAVERELAIEARHAFAFTPTIDLMHAANARGMKIVIVSDMYMSESQLRAHIAQAAGDDVLALIDCVFVSGSVGFGKRDGLFGHVLATLGIAPDEMLHVGDNHAADVAAPRALGIHAVHFVQFDDESAARLRMEALAATLINPAAGVSSPICQAHRGQISARPPGNPAAVFGHDVLGPVMLSFVQWIKAELDEAAKRLQCPVRPLFVMRDGHLPFELFRRLYPHAGAATVDLSRFVALRASMTDAAAIDDYLAQWGNGLPVRALGRQLMLFEHEIAGFSRKGSEADAQQALAAAVRKPEWRHKIEVRRKAFVEKLKAHLARAGVNAGDAVMLIDIGYNGTVQNLLTPVLQGAMDLKVSGRYLFLREKRASGLDKRGMIDARHYDYRTLHALSLSIVVLEQVCNAEQGSTIDFTAAGEPVREAIDAKAAHNANRAEIQAGCIRFVEQAGRGVLRAPVSDDLTSRCQAAAASLARLFFLPNASEVALFGGFDYDMNMGSALSARIVDPERGARGLRRHGLGFYSDESAMFMSAELQQQGFPVSLASFAAARFKLDLRATDFQVGGIDIPVLFVTPDDQYQTSLTAWPTSEGYYRMQVPVAATPPTLAIQVGRICEFVQIEELSITPLSHLKRGTGHRTARTVNGVLEALDTVGPDLYRAQPTGLVMVTPPVADEPAVVSLVFRPIVLRTQAIELRAAA